MKYLGIVSMGHDASVALIDGYEILFAGHAERYSHTKNDGDINEALLKDCLKYGRPQEVVWYERPMLKRSRQLFAGQYQHAFKTTSIRQHLSAVGLTDKIIHTVSHHKSHAAAGYFTSPFTDASILVCDAIGEWTCISIWEAYGGSLRQIWAQSYPHSLGLFYSAITQRCGLKPNEEEYILMGMAALGQPKYVDALKSDFVSSSSGPDFKLKVNVHRGILWWRPTLNTEQDFYDLAASAQAIVEEYLEQTITWMAKNMKSRNLVMMGGVALNCVANSKIAKLGIFDDIWIMPNPGDAGSSIGAVAAHIGSHLQWNSPYLGYDIKRELDYDAALALLLKGEPIGIANGRAEFGPRALGNRSLICDPRGPHVKDLINKIKKREPFRPFAPIILEHLAHQYFDMPVATSPYMQFTAKCKFPEQFPAICHFDGSSRVQTLNQTQNPVFYGLLDRFYQVTGCPMLLNTSLNIKGQPLVNTWLDAVGFRTMYGVQVF
jgi:carbamoyltransferase